ncbi:DUF418 domain-containing protein [Paenibacillus sp. LHD-117]|uniref:DUF418 domain-containing protein n=1 Tax=Paenibacillus sp. LHD-117 TaxID=3071412 RepID=UPI0027E0B785|nr:DUF418 domain-containing protein [Paenibacillus sp. LHD-117]MDQ6419863.1 DUF418 domain-containing protein [Paenibacillus sp. LHD-117]
MERLELTRRIDDLDVLRGFALLGILLMNAIPLLHLSDPAPGTIDVSYQRFLYLFVEARFFSLFSFLFGVGFYLFITRASGKGRNGYLLFLKRVVVLFGFGWLHMKVHPGEALSVYAVCGLLLLPMYKVGKWINLAVGLALTVAFSVMAAKILLPLSLILLGIAAGQFRVFEKLARHRGRLALFTLIMLALSAAALFYQYGLAPEGPFSPYLIGGTGSSETEQANAFMSAGVMIGPIVSGLYAGTILLLLQRKAGRMLLLPLKFYGRMALTNYIGQTALVIAAGDWLSLRGNIGWTELLGYLLAIHIVLMAFSMLWLKWFAMGPLEWIWRALTYFRWPPVLNRKRGNKSAAGG